MIERISGKEKNNRIVLDHEFLCAGSMPSGRHICLPNINQRPFDHTFE